MGTGRKGCGQSSGAAEKVQGEGAGSPTPAMISPVPVSWVLPSLLQASVSLALKWE